MNALLQALQARAGIDAWNEPAWLVAAALAGAVAWSLGIIGRTRHLRWPALDEARRAGLRRVEWLRPTATTLRACAIAALVALFAGPVGIHRLPPPPGEGLDLMLVTDASDSMQALDTRVGGAARTRLDLAREVVSRFARQRAAAGDRVGLVVFGDAAFTQSPLTSDGRLLAAALERVGPGIAGDATALGDALALAVKRLARGDGDAGRVVVLLTDGRHNAGAFAPDEAAALAAATGVRVHTVAIGTAGRAVAMARPDQRSGDARTFERVDVDGAALARIAAATGGRFHAARGSADLVRVYDEIDRMERVARRRPPRLRRESRRESLLAVAGILLLAEIALARVLHRRLP